MRKFKTFTVRGDHSLHFLYWLLGWEYSSLDSQTSDFLNSFQQREVIMIRFTINPDHRHAAKVSPPIASELERSDNMVFIVSKYCKLCALKA